MLIKCEDCGHDVSDKAVACLYCGCPINPNNSTPTIKQAPKRALFKRRKPMRRANGTGSIRKLNGNRRRPYGAYPPVTQYHSNGTAILPKPIGYYATYNEALEALVMYNKTPFDITARSMTFAELYEKWFDQKFIHTSKKLSKNAEQTYKSAYGHCKALWDKPYASLRTEDMQRVLDESELKHSSQEQVVLLFKALGKYAHQIDIVAKDYAQFVKINIEDDTEKGVPFYENELEILWQHSDSKVVQMILIMIYSGFRISAFENIEVNIKEQYFQGGVKTKAGKNRIVPIHPRISQFISEDTFKGFKAHSFRITFTNTLDELGIVMSVLDTKHTPHDCRHTFSWLCDKYGVNTTSKHMLMGHAMTGDVEQKVYSHRTIDDLRKEIEKIV